METTLNVRVSIDLTDRLAALLENLTKAQACICTQQTKIDTVMPETATPAETKNEKEYTEADVREAMERTRRRIEGENYKEETDSEGYKQWHRKLTAYFKSTAQGLGADKPSALEKEKRKMFVQFCDAVTTQGDELAQKLPQELDEAIPF